MIALGRASSHLVIPAKAGIQKVAGCYVRRSWTPAFAGVTCFLIALCSYNHSARADEAESDSNPPETPAATTLTLQECLDRAIRLNPLLDASAYDVAAAEAGRDAAWGRRWATVESLMLGGPVPEARGDGTATTTGVDTIEAAFRGLGPFFQFRVQVTQPLFTFGKLSNARDGLEHVAHMKRAKKDEIRWEVATQVKILYQSWLFLEELSALIDDIQEKLDKAKKNLENMLAEEREGVSPKDRLRLKLFQADIDAQRVEVEGRLEVVKSSLTRLLMMDINTQWRPRDKALGSPELQGQTLVELTNLALGDHPEMKRVQHGLLALEAQTRFHRSQFLPDLFLAGQFGYGVAPNRDDQRNPFLVDNFNYLRLGIALGLRYKLDAGSKHHELAKARAELASLQAKKTALTAKLEQQLHTAYTKYNGHKDKLKITKKAFRTARSWTSSAMNGLELGTGSVKDVTDAFKEYIKVRFGLLEATYNLNVAAAKLSQAAGYELQTGLNVQAPQ